MKNTSESRYTDQEARKKYRRDFMRKYMKTYRIKCKKEGRYYWGNASAKARVKAIEALGGPICVKCGCTSLSILEINHKSSGHRKSWAVGHARLKALRAIVRGSIDRGAFDVRCRVCNALHYVQEILGIKGHKVTWLPEFA